VGGITSNEAMPPSAPTTSRITELTPAGTVNESEPRVVQVHRARGIKHPLVTRSLTTRRSRGVGSGAPRGGRLEPVPRHRCQAHETRCSRSRPSRARCLRSRRRVWLICRVPAQRPDLCVVDQRHVGGACARRRWTGPQRRTAMRAGQIGRSATVAVTFGQQGQRHANEGKWKWYQILHAVQVIFVARYLRDRALQREIK
jgi:hypothetical protein